MAKEGESTNENAGATETALLRIIAEKNSEILALRSAVQELREALSGHPGDGEKIVEELKGVVEDCCKRLAFELSEVANLREKISATIIGRSLGPLLCIATGTRYVDLSKVRPWANEVKFGPKNPLPPPRKKECCSHESKKSIFDREPNEVDCPYGD